MKKIWIILIILLFSTGCTNEKTIKCSLKANTDEGIYSNNVEAIFNGEEFVYYVFETSMEYKNISDATAAYEMFSGLENDYKEIDMTFKSTINQNVVDVTIEADIKKLKDNLGEEEKEYLHADLSKTTFIRELEEEGYTCK